MSRINSEVFARALSAATQLKQQLETRLVGQTAKGWSCCCGTIKVGPSRVVGVEMPVDYPHHLGQHISWRCSMEDDNGKRWAQGIDSYISWAELFPMFRNHFAGIPLKLDHPMVAYHSDAIDEDWGDRAAKAGRFFKPSGRTVVVAADAGPVYIRPKHNRTDAAWVSAELRIDTGVYGYQADTALMTCHIDSFELECKNGRDAGEKQHFPDAERLLTYYCRVIGQCDGKDLYLPIARVIAVDNTRAAATFELDQSVEIFEL